MQLLAPAKINLHLRVGPRRADGFHPLLSWMCTVGLFDTLDLESLPGSADAHDSTRRAVELTCDLPELPCDASNLVVRVVTAWMEEMRLGEPSPASHLAGIRATLAKRIPMGGGLGGGSSDGAATLIGLNRLFDAGWSRQRLSDLAARFGSDLSFFFHGPSSVCTGRGEFVRPIGAPACRAAVLLLPPISMPTGPVYQRYDALGLGRDEDIRCEPDWSEWRSMKARQLLPRLVNDLERPAFDLSPALARLRDQAERQVERAVRMSGSGSTLFTLFDTIEESNEAAVEIAKACSVKTQSVELAVAPAGS